jgi:predicted DNA-binding transcriptional regulator AlpA
VPGPTPIRTRVETEPPVFLTVAAFCRAHSISRSYFYKLQKRGMAPPSVMLGRKRLIATEDAARWRQSLMEPERNE